LLSLVVLIQSLEVASSVLFLAFSIGIPRISILLLTITKGKAAFKEIARLRVLLKISLALSLILYALHDYDHLIILGNEFHLI
jgi:hypothetical protein